MEKRHLLLPTGVATILEALLHKMIFKDQTDSGCSSSKRSFLFLNRVHNIIPMLYQTKSYKGISQHFYPTPRAHTDFLSPHQF